jgi:hypothetical protein
VVIAARLFRSARFVRFVGVAAGATSLASLCALASCNTVFGWDSASLDPNANGNVEAGADGASDAGADGASDADDTRNAVACDKYCSSIKEHCTANNTQYISDVVCKAMCLQMDRGFAGEENTEADRNTVVCRQSQLDEDAGDVNSQCLNAGPLGGTVCGKTLCESFCRLDFKLCGTQNDPPYASEGACLTACGKYNYDAGIVLDKAHSHGGDTLNCRNYHLQNAYGGDLSSPDPARDHCPHTKEVSTTCCVGCL